MLCFQRNCFEQICARCHAVVVNYNKSTDCVNMPKTVRLKCSTGGGYGCDIEIHDFADKAIL